MKGRKGLLPKSMELAPLKLGTMNLTCMVYGIYKHSIGMENQIADQNTRKGE